MNEDNCKNWSQAFFLETKEASASNCPTITKESWTSFEFSEILHAEGWNCFFRQKNIHFGGKVTSTKRQSAGQTLRGRSCRHVNCLSPPEASICHGLGSSVKNLEISSDFCETWCQSQHKCVHDILAHALRDMKEHFKNKDFIIEQDSPSHTSNKTQAWCKDNFLRVWSKELWPPSSPDLNLMEFSVWSMLETEACHSSHITV